MNPDDIQELIATLLALQKNVGPVTRMLDLPTAVSSTMFEEHRKNQRISLTTVEQNKYDVYWWELKEFMDSHRRVRINEHWFLFSAVQYALAKEFFERKFASANLQGKTLLEARTMRAGAERITRMVCEMQGKPAPDFSDVLYISDTETMDNMLVVIDRL
jgi:hypothetical protein